METRNKRWRIEQRNKIYASKMRLFAAYGGEFFLNDERMSNPRWVDLYKANWSPCYKSVRTPCSCWLCKGEVYNRRLHKLETGRVLGETL